MIPLTDARDRVLRDCVRLPEQVVELRGALGLVTTQPVVATEPVPPSPTPAWTASRWSPPTPPAPATSSR